MRCFEGKFYFWMTIFSDFWGLYDVSLMQEIQENLGLKTCATNKKFSGKSRYIVLQTNFIFDLVASPAAASYRLVTISRSHTSYLMIETRRDRQKDGLSSPITTSSCMHLPSFHSSAGCSVVLSCSTPASIFPVSAGAGCSLLFHSTTNSSSTAARRFSWSTLASCCIENVYKTLVVATGAGTAVGRGVGARVGLGVGTGGQVSAEV